MTVRNPYPTTSEREETVDRLDDKISKNIAKISPDEVKQIKKNPLYKGRVSYVKDILLDYCPDLDPELLSEKLDVNLKTAVLILQDCQRKEEPAETEQ
jgi:hypothetical protein